MTNINFEIFLGNVSFLILFLIMILYWVQLIFSIIPKFNVVIFFTTTCVNLVLFTLLVLRWVNYGHFPLSNLYESLIFLSWNFSLVQLIFLALVKTKIQFSPLSSLSQNSTLLLFGNDATSRVASPVVLERKGQSSNFLQKENLFQQNFFNINVNIIIGSILAPIALFTNSFAAFSLPKSMQQAHALVPALQSNWLMMHVSVMMLSYAALLCGSLLSITFLIITWQLSQNDEIYNKDSEISLLNKEVPINVLATTLDNLSYRVLGIGFPLLTIGILSGAVWANEAWGSYWSWDPKETWAFITWLIFAIYLHTRITKGWEGKKPAILASFGFFVVWICYLGVNLLGTGLHSYGWIK